MFSLLPPALLADATADQPLPVEMTGRAVGWLGHYRRFPVFSRPWALGRIRAWGSVLLLLSMVFLGTLLLSTPLELMPWGGLLHLLLLTGLPLVGGPLAGVWVHRQTWPPRRETGALAAALLAVVVAVGVLSHLAAEPMKQFIAEQTGAIDANGKRKRLIVMIGIHLETADDASDKPSGDAAEPPLVVQLVNAALGGMLQLWLAGGLALRGLQRERLALTALRRERELAAATAGRREAEMRLSVLAAQVEPHFLFNTLAGLRSAIATDPGRASAMVDRLADYLRASIPRLRSDGSVVTTVGSQLDSVRAYLGLMADRMPRLHVDILAPAELLAARCPPLMLISLAENAVKHGVEQKIGPVLIEVRAERASDGRLRITVADDGVGFGAGGQAGGGLGLANIRDRLAQLYAGRAELALQQRPAGGVAATLWLPFESTDEWTDEWPNEWPKAP